MFSFVKNIGPTEIIVLIVVLVIFFGSRIAIGIGRTSGQTLKEIKKIKEEIMGKSDKGNQKEVSK